MQVDRIQDFTDPAAIDGTEFSPQRGSHAVWWFLGGVAAIALIGCAGILGVLMYVGMNGPDTSVYTGNRVPAKFLRSMEKVGALDADENILFFYSDAMTDILDGFYFVSDKKVVIYSQTSGASPLTIVAFDDIKEAEFYQNESFFEDSEITLYLEDGQILSFPASSENGRDQEFFDAIRDRTADATND